MRSIYKCPICVHEEEFFDEDVYAHHESVNEAYFECMNDYYDGLMEI